MQEAAQIEKVLFTRFFGGQKSQSPVGSMSIGSSGAKTPEISWEMLIFSQFNWSRWQESAILTIGKDQKRGFLRF